MTAGPRGAGSREGHARHRTHHRCVRPPEPPARGRARSPPRVSRAFARRSRGPAVFSRPRPSLTLPLPLSPPLQRPNQRNKSRLARRGEGGGDSPVALQGGEPLGALADDPDAQENDPSYKGPKDPTKIAPRARSSSTTTTPWAPAARPPARRTTCARSTRSAPCSSTPISVTAGERGGEGHREALQGSPDGV